VAGQQNNGAPKFVPRDCLFRSARPDCERYHHKPVSPSGIRNRLCPKRCRLPMATVVSSPFFGEEEMRGIPFVRIACASLAVPVASLISFPTLPSAIKGDEPPVVTSEKQHRPQLQTYEKIPFGCDSAFSPIDSAGRVNVLRRCVV
jgi:hypothetical protein